MNKWIRITEGETTFFLNQSNIAGVSISTLQPSRLVVLMIGDTEAQIFTFPNVQERNNKLSEIIDENSSILYNQIPLTEGDLS